MKRGIRILEDGVPIAPSLDVERGLEADAVRVWVTCGRCHGRGRMCPMCAGRGRMQITRAQAQQTGVRPLKVTIACNVFDNWQGYAGGRPVVEFGLDKARAEAWYAANRARGRGPAERARKVQVSIRVTPEALEAFRATGEGWAARIGASVERAAKRIGGDRHVR